MTYKTEGQGEDTQTLGIQRAAACSFRDSEQEDASVCVSSKTRIMRVENIPRTDDCQRQRHHNRRPELPSRVLRDSPKRARDPVHFLMSFF